MSAEYLRKRIHALELRRDTDPHFSFADAELLKNFQIRLRQKRPNSPARRANNGKRSSSSSSPSRRRNRSSPDRQRNAVKGPRTPLFDPNSFFYNEYLQSNSNSNSNSNSLPPVDDFLPDRAQANSDSTWLRSYFRSLEQAMS